jgi:hypothetical protein
LDSLGPKTTSGEISDSGSSEISLDGEIAVRPDRQIATLLMIVGFLALWVVGGGKQFDRIPAAVRGQQSWLAILWAVLWLAPIVVLTLEMSWRLWGAQVVSVRGGVLTMIRRIGPMPISRPIECATTDVRAMQVEERVYRSRGRSWSRHVITFECHGQRRDLLINLSEDRARSLLAGPLHKFART